MFINITVEVRGERRDIRIDSNQKIGEGFAVLSHSGKLPHVVGSDYFHSRLNRRPVSAYKTFSEEQVYDGDVLSAII